MGGTINTNQIRMCHRLATRCVLLALSHLFCHMSDTLSLNVDALNILSLSVIVVVHPTPSNQRKIQTKSAGLIYLTMMTLTL